MVARDLRAGLTCCASAEVEHVGSTSVPGLAAKPILDIDVIVDQAEVIEAVRALTALGYVHRGDLGVGGREAFGAPDDGIARHVYVVTRGTLAVRNHLAVRDTLRARPDLRDEYAAVKLALAADPAMGIDAYLALKTPILQRVLAAGGLSDAELEIVARLNAPVGE